MTSRGISEGRSIRKMAVAGAVLATAGFSLLLLTGFPSGLSADAGTSEALAELAARSPGARIGGIALKAKTKRGAPLVRAAALGRAPTPASAVPIASVMGAGPEGPLGSAPTALETMPGALIAPGAPAITALPAPGGIGFVPGPGGGGVVIGPGPGSGGTPGGGGAIVPTPTPTPSSPSAPTSTPTPTIPPVSAIPEPGTWLMLIAGFGLLGAAMRKQRRFHCLA